MDTGEVTVLFRLTFQFNATIQTNSEGPLPSLLPVRVPGDYLCALMNLYGPIISTAYSRPGLKMLYLSRCLLYPRSALRTIALLNAATYCKSSLDCCLENEETASFSSGLVLSAQ